MLHVVKTHDGDSIEAMARAHLSPTVRVVSDGLGCFRAVTRIGCGHEPMVAARLGWSEQLPCFRWVNTVLRNIKTAIVSTLKSGNKRYVFRYFLALAAILWVGCIDDVFASMTMQAF